MADCLATVPGCRDCADYPWRAADVHPGQCDDLCRMAGESMRSDEGMHRFYHDPVCCEKCGAVLDDRRGNDHAVARLCPERTCTHWCCPGCGHSFSSAGPVGCPECSPVGWLGLAWARVTAPWRRRRGEARRG